MSSSDRKGDEDFGTENTFYKHDGSIARTFTINKALEEYERGDVIVGEGSVVWTPLERMQDGAFLLSYNTVKGIAYGAGHSYAAADLGRTFAGLVRRAFFNLKKNPDVLTGGQDEASICEEVAGNDLMVQALNLMGDTYRGGDEAQRKFCSMAWDYAFAMDYWSTQDLYFSQKPATYA